MPARAATVDTGCVSASWFRVLAQTCIEPVLVRAGFAKGQWAEERGATDDPSCAVTFCAGQTDYVDRYPRLADDAWHSDHTYCVDIIVEGSIRRGITRLDVESESLGQLLERTGRHSDVERLPRLLRLRNPERDFEDLAEVLSDLYAVSS